MSLKFTSLPDSNIVIFSTTQDIILNKQFTIESYINISSPIANTEILLFGQIPPQNSTGLYMQLILSTQTTMKPIIRLVGNTMTAIDHPFDTAQFGQDEYPILKNKWVHICLVRNGRSFIFYIDGLIIGTASINTLYNISYSSDNLSILQKTPGITSYTSAEIYNFEIYNGLKYSSQTLPISEAVPSDLTNYLLVLNGIRSPLTGEVQNGQTLGTWAPYVTKNNITYSDFNGKTYSTVCFVAGTRVLTDHGYIPIECIDYNTHEIFGKKIIAVTKTVTPETHLACVSKNALSPGVPDKDTLMTLNHKIKFNCVLTEVYQFVNLLPGISLVKYNQEPLFNVLLENHDVMIVNNMIVETLDPENLLAKMFIKMKELSLADRETLINMYNDYIKEKFQDSIKMLNLTI